MNKKCKQQQNIFWKFCSPQPSVKRVWLFARAVWEMSILIVHTLSTLSFSPSMEKREVCHPVTGRASRPCGKSASHGHSFITWSLRSFCSMCLNVGVCWEGNLCRLFWLFSGPDNPALWHVERTHISKWCVWFQVWITLTCKRWVQPCSTRAA